jgi:hypothetical protein
MQAVKEGAKIKEKSSQMQPITQWVQAGGIRMKQVGVQAKDTLKKVLCIMEDVMTKSASEALNMEIEEGEQNVEPKKLDFDVMGTRSS